ncbi:MAG: alpha/beta hydrolase [Armatimonadota bacterium]|nr:alpha/beta hydrolase [Armatimonadota bacterium]
MPLLDLGFVRLRDGTRLRYRCLGNGGPTVLLLHGWPETGHAWRHILPTLAASGYLCVAPDQRGAGDSDKPSGGYEAATRMEDVRELVSALGLDDGPLFAVGHGAGGADAAGADAAQHPEEVSGVAFISALPGASGSGWQGGFHQTPDLPELLIAPQADAYLRHFFRAWSHDPEMLPAADRAVNVRALTEPGALRASLAPFRVPASASLPPVTVPRLLLLGESDPHRADIIPPPHIHVETIPRGGYWLPEERPDPVAAALLTFFREIRD